MDFENLTPLSKIKNSQQQMPKVRKARAKWENVDTAAILKLLQDKVSTPVIVATFQGAGGKVYSRQEIVSKVGNIKSKMGAKLKLKVGYVEMEGMVSLTSRSFLNVLSRKSTHYAR